MWFLCCFAEFWHRLMVCHFLQLMLLGAYGDVLQFYKYDLKYITLFNHWFFKCSTSIFKTNRDTSWWSLGKGGKTRYRQINISNNITLPRYHVDQIDIHVQHGYNLLMIWQNSALLLIWCYRSEKLSHAKSISRGTW